jgi:hypothetical protein
MQKFRRGENKMRNIQEALKRCQAIADYEKEKAEKEKTLNNNLDNTCYKTSYNTSFKDSNNTYYNTSNKRSIDFQITRTIRRAIEKEGRFLSEENYMLLHDFLKENLNVFTPGTLIKQYGVLTVVEAIEATVENQNKVKNLGAYFMGTVKRLKIA